MILAVQKNKMIGDLQYDFNQAYPFLKIEIYKYSSGRMGSDIKEKLNKTVLLNDAGAFREGELEVTDSMTVGKLEKAFYEKFGMNVQVSRKSGTIWLETTMTDRWTLKQQNEHGRELSTPANEPLRKDEIDYD